MKKIIKFGNARRRIGACICGTEFYFDNEDMKNGEVSCPVCGKNVRVKRDEGEKIEVWTKKCVYCGIKIDRDLNAAINIERMGVDILYNRTRRDEVANPVEAFKIE